MIKVNLEKELEDGREKAISQANSDDLKEVKQLLLEKSKAETDVLKEAGLFGNFQKQERLLGMSIKRKELEDEFGEGNVKIFTEDEVKALCVKYNLRMLHSKRYKGYIEPLLGAKIVRFFENRKVNGSAVNWEAANNLFIMAPKKAFNLDERPEPPRNVDPALFYKITTTEGTMYALVHKWGVDFTVFRRVQGIFRKNPESWLTFKSLVLFTAIMTGFAIFGVNPIGWPTLISAAGGLLIAFIHTAAVTPDGSSGIREYSQRFSEDGWNSVFQK
jgi:hypothetical protein